MGKNNKNDTGEQLDYLDTDTFKVGSTMDCTGLIPSAPKTQEEEESYEELYNYRADKILNRNQPTIDPTGKTAFFCHSYEQKVPPKKFGFDSLPGSETDLRNAREAYEGEEN